LPLWRRLNVIAGDKVLDDERLLTLFGQVEELVNQRPLTPVSDDPSCFKVLSPIDLLRPYAPSMVIDEGVVKLSERDQYRKRWRHVQFLVQCFWNRWVKEYLPLLSLRKKWKGVHRNCRVGDLVLVSSEALPQNDWPLARVIETHLGDDGLVRSVKVKTSSGIFVRVFVC
jgi:hypothetical protein